MLASLVNKKIDKLIIFYEAVIVTHEAIVQHRLENPETGKTIEREAIKDVLGWADALLLGLFLWLCCWNVLTYSS